MLGCRSGFQSYVKAVSPNVTSVHCFIHRFALCIKVLPAQLLACLKQVVKIINFVKASALNSLPGFLSSCLKTLARNIPAFFITPKSVGFLAEMLLNVCSK